MFTFSRLSLAWQFLLSSFLILLVGMLVIGTWVGLQIERGVTQRTAALTAVYVDSLVGHHLPPMAATAELDPEEWAPIDILFAHTPMGRQVISFKLWGPDGRILYSPDKSLIGRKFPVTAELSDAFLGHVHTNVVEPAKPGNPEELAYSSTYSSTTITTFAPVHTNGADTIVAVAEFRQIASDLKAEISAAQQRSWAVVAAATLAMYILLAGLVGRASAIISRQQRERQDQVKQLTALLEQNAQLNERVHRAAARSTALNERFLRRLSSELHDGPCQDIGLALLRMEPLADAYDEAGALPKVGPQGKDYRTIQTALKSALAELRTISTGLWLPALDSLSPSAVGELAVRHYASKTGADVAVSLEDLPDEAPLPVKITLYRLLQEALNNSFRHAAGRVQRVRLWADAGDLCAEVSDDGTGFDPAAIPQNGHLGLLAMRERVELLGGAFDLQTAPERGTAVRARLPLSLPEDRDG